MEYEHLPGDRFTFGKGEHYCFDSDEREVSDTDVLPISEILRSIIHEKFILSLLAVIGIGKLILFAKIYQII